jgi:3'-phosphoadenosine 5'-phosphosulfate sulfotransferase (PAPS reductase)/FAD synthetase
MRCRPPSPSPALPVLDMPTLIRDLIARGALFVISHSGGKDSQAMYALLRDRIPASQILVIHAHLPGACWPGTAQHAQRYLRHPYIEVEARKTFIEMVLARGHFPSPQYRQCTSDLKRGPIEKAIRQYLTEHPEHGGLVVNCMGLRGEESRQRRGLIPLKANVRNSRAGRQWFDWLPIHGLTEEQVFAVITGSGEQPHWVYGAGMKRCSCVICIMASREDREVARSLSPETFVTYRAAERTIGRTMAMNGEPLA